MRQSGTFILLSACTASCSVLRRGNDTTKFDPLVYVDQLIGSANGGNVFAGATLPYGMAKAVADTNGDSNQGGFQMGETGGSVTGFSGMHDSGTGGLPSLGNFPIFPHVSCEGDDLNNCKFPKQGRAQPYNPDSVKASPGYFGLTLGNGIAADMTAAQHTSLFRFKFPSSGGSPLIQLDLTDLSDSRQDNATISVDAGTNRMTGHARFQPSFAQGYYTAFFCADFSGGSVRDNGIYANTRASNQVKDLTISRSINGYPLPGGAFVRFNDASEPIMARVGVSMISSDQACSNAEKEIAGFDFDGTKSAAEDIWREKLGRIEVETEGVDPSLVTNFYSGIYRTMVNPQDYTGENPLWKSDEPYFDSFYCIWDLFRSQLPFLTILDTEAVEKMIRSLIDTYRHVGWLPDCRLSLNKGYTQGGSNADNVLADAYLKGLDGGIDWNAGYEAVVKDAEVEPYDWCCEGRGGLDSWKELGYIPKHDFDYKGFGTMTRTVSRTLEYSYNDFCIAQMATKLGKKSDAEKYEKRSMNWENLFKDDQTSLNKGADTGFVGFFQPRYLNSSWALQDPLMCSNIDDDPKSVCSLQRTAGETFESSLWEYSFFVPHAQAALIKKLGGPEAFTKRLNYIHDQNITYIGNEPAFLTVFQYHYAGRPALSALRAHSYIPSSFSPTPAGLPGNDDSGAMGSFVAFSMMGLFPNPGQDVYLITPPFFPEIKVTSPVSGKVATIKANNFDADYKNLYIQNATLDGEEYTKNWIGHEFFVKGGTLEVTLGRNESHWGTQVKDLPPSLGDYEGYNQTSWKRSKLWKSRFHG